VNQLKAAGAEMTPIAGLPDDALLFLVPSRYCDSDKLADFAWSRFGRISGGYRRVQAICNFVHAKVRFRRKLHPLRERIGAGRRGRLPRLRSPRHRTLPLHEHSRPLLHQPSRRHWRSGRYQPHGFQRLVRGLSRWALVHDGRALQPSRIGRIVMGRGRDAADVAMSTAFGVARLVRFEVVTDEKVQGA
jgi:hypothetical protein